MGGTQNVSALILVLTGGAERRLRVQRSWNDRAADYGFDVIYAGYCPPKKAIDAGVRCLPCCAISAGGGADRGKPEMITRLKYAYEVGMAAGNYNFILKCDDDTHINYRNLASFVQTLDPLKRAIYGQCDKVPWEPRPFCGGGAGVLAPIHLLREMLPQWPSLGPEDVALSNLAADMGASLNKINGFEPECSRPFHSSISLHHCIK